MECQCQSKEKSQRQKKPLNMWPWSEDQRRIWIMNARNTPPHVDLESTAYWDQERTWHIVLWWYTHVPNMISQCQTKTKSWAGHKSAQIDQARIQGKAYPPPPEKNVKDYGTRDRYIHLLNDKCAHVSINSDVTIIYLSFFGNFVFIMETLLGSCDLEKWLNHNSKGPKFSASAVYWIEQGHLRSVPLYFSHNLEKKTPYPSLILYIVNDDLHRYMNEGVSKSS